jgi:gamma-glutamyltranspeptidase / glutathione hydrolase
LSRDFQTPGRSLVMSARGMAATSHPASTGVAIDVLQAGGNAMDAAIAACAVQCVVEPGSTGIGGDCFVLYAPRGTAEIFAFNGSGRAPRAAAAERLRAEGLTAIGAQSPHAITIPGAVDAWSQLLRDHGTRELGTLLQPAITYARDGYAVAPRVHLEWTEAAPLLAQDPNARAIFLPDGKAPALGTIHRQPALAATLEVLAKKGRDGFYFGPVAEDIVTYLRGLGGLHTLEDFATAGGEYVAPIRTRFRDHEVFECPPNGQGVIALLILNILSGLPHDADPLSAERLYLEIEAARLAYAVRDAHLADPKLASVDTDWLLSESLASELRGRIKGHASKPLGLLDTPEHKDTVYISVVDRDRNAVSFINSLFNQYGSGRLAPRSGVLLHNRGMSFSLKSGHPNEIAPGKRPMHTIIPGMLVRDGRAEMPFGVMGGHYQAMGQAYFLSRVIDYGMDLQAAMDLPRVFPLPGTHIVEVESRIPAWTLEGLRRRGFELARAKKPIGGSQAIWIDWKNGTLIGASDPRKDGCALGY